MAQEKIGDIHFIYTWKIWSEHLDGEWVRIEWAINLVLLRYTRHFLLLLTQSILSTLNVDWHQRTNQRNALHHSHASDASCSVSSDSWRSTCTIYIFKIMQKKLSPTTKSTNKNEKLNHTPNQLNCVNSFVHS